MLLPPPQSTAEKTHVDAAVVGSSSMYALSQLPNRPQHMYTPRSAASGPMQDNIHNNPNIMRHTPNTTASLISFQSAQTSTTSGSNQISTNGSSRTIRQDHSFNIDQPLSPTFCASRKHPHVERDRLGTFESVMAVRSLGSGHRRGHSHGSLAQQMLSVAADEGRDAKSSLNDTDDASLSSLSDDGTSSGVAAGGRAVKKALLKKSRSIRKKSRSSRPGSISGRQTSDQAPSIATSITSVTHTMETIDCSFPSPLTAEINVEKVKSSRELMGNHRKSQSSISGASFPLSHRSSMIHDSWTSPTPGYGETLSMQPEKGEDLIDVSSDAPIDPFSGLIGMPSASISMCDNSFASGTTSSLEKPKTSTFLRKPAMARSNSVNSEFDPFSKVKSDIPRAPRYLRDNPLLSKSKYRGRLSPPVNHKRAPSLDTACMIGSIAMSETSAPTISPTDNDSLVSNLPPIPQQASSADTKEADEDDDSSYASFREELNRKDWGKGFVNDALNNLADKMLPLVGLKPRETNLKRADGCLT
eukprot:scaffold33283_cov143-Skeletonema_menzelii.AAC.5